eukprot:jgi/Astpho2/4273/Aster-x0198
MMNEAFQAREGLPPDLFPDTIPTYTGHYHKPHTVSNTSIRYVGSPYQSTSLFPARSPHYQTQPERETGIKLELIIPPQQSAPRIEAAEELGAIGLLQAYAEAMDMTPDAAAVGRELLRELEGNGAKLKPESAAVEFHCVELEGYGPFRDVVAYDLRQRGVCVISGRNEDNAGAVSNGAGKSALAMSALWAITGRSDARIEGGAGRGLTNAEVVNDDCKQARVHVEGRVNGQDFTIERSVRGRGKGKLTFQLDGADLTMAEIKLTQAEVDRHLAADMLMRAVFHGQADITALLESNDERFKAELGKVIEMEVWEQAKAESSKQLKATTSQKAATQTEQAVRQQHADTLEAQVAAAQYSADAYQAAHQQEAQELREQVLAALQQLQAAQQQCLGLGRQLHSWLAQPHLLSADLLQSEAAAQHELAQLESQAEAVTAELAALEQRLQDEQEV